MHDLGFHEYWAAMWSQFPALSCFCRELKVAGQHLVLARSFFGSERTLNFLDFRTIVTIMEGLLSTQSTNLALFWSLCGIYGALLRQVGIVSGVPVL